MVFHLDLMHQNIDVGKIEFINSHTIFLIQVPTFRKSKIWDFFFITTE
ncbi:MAG: hypothetical protein ACI85O_002508 [Saprospiraceae bacterium]|jgi:hypothetical protein